MNKPKKLVSYCRESTDPKRAAGFRSRQGSFYFGSRGIGRIFKKSSEY